MLTYPTIQATGMTLPLPPYSLAPTHNRDRFENRTDAGRLLAQELLACPDFCVGHDLLILALPRGGVPVAFEIAKALCAPLDLALVRKLSVPGYEEWAIGAVAMGGIRVLNKDVVQLLRISDEAIHSEVDAEEHVLERYNRLYRGGRPSPDASGGTVILVDDGMATGATMRAAIAGLRRSKQPPAHIIVAIPVASLEACERLYPLVDRFICLSAPNPLNAVGMWYNDFEPVSDTTIRSLLLQSSRYLAFSKQAR